MSRTKGQGPRARGQGPRAKDQGPRAKDQGPRAKGQGPRAKDQGPMTNDRRNEVRPIAANVVRSCSPDWPLVISPIVSGISTAGTVLCPKMPHPGDPAVLGFAPRLIEGGLGACGGAASAAARGLARIAHLGFSARFRATRSRCIWLWRSRSRRMGMISSKLAEPFATIPIMMNMYLLGRPPM